MLAAYAAGEPVKVIAERFGVHRGTVWARAKKAGIAPPARTLDTKTLALAVELYGDGLSLARIAARLGVSRAEVRATLVRAGAVIRTGGGHRSREPDPPTGTVNGGPSHG